MRFTDFFQCSTVILSAVAIVATCIACDSDEGVAAGASGTSGTSGTSGAGGSGGGAGASSDSGSDSGLVGVEVTTELGKLRGKADGEVSAFLGVPYAASTEGQNRWKPPQPASPWSGTRDATTFGKLCPQITPGATTYDPNSSEDCLLVNVWTPDLTPSSPLPVMVWIHGGAFVFGSGGPPYDGTLLARTHGIVVVTINYRLGAFGFLAHPALSAEGSVKSSGAYGIMDQTAALEWVKKNIGVFGGDAANVTVFGESAGGRSVCWHLMSPASRGLFQRAIIESGLCMMQGDTLATAEAQGERFATAMGCSAPDQALSCLRGRPPNELITSSPNTQPGGLFYQSRGDSFFFQAMVDGVVMPGQPDALLAAGTVAKVAVIHGSNTSEGALFHTGVFRDVQPATEAEYRDALGRRFGARATEIVAEYPVAGFPSPNDALTAVTSDAFFVCSARRMARLLSAAGVTNHLYSFDGPLDPALLPALNGKAFHSAEIPYVFGNDFVLGKIPDAFKPLADAVKGYWTRFAKSGDPNGGMAPAWPVYAQSSDQHLALGMTIAAGSAHNKAKCDFWDNIPLVP